MHAAWGPYARRGGEGPACSPAPSFQRRLESRARQPLTQGNRYRFHNFCAKSAGNPARTGVACSRREAYIGMQEPSRRRAVEFCGGRHGPGAAPEGSAERKEVHHGYTRGLRAASPVALPLYGPPRRRKRADGGGQSEAGSSVIQSRQKRPERLDEARGGLSPAVIAGNGNGAEGEPRAMRGTKPVPERLASLSGTSVGPLTSRRTPPGCPPGSSVPPCR